MDNKELLERLNEEKEILSKLLKDKEAILSEKLHAFITSLMTYDGLKLLPIELSAKREYEINYKANTTRLVKKVYVQIRFANEKGECYNDGNIKEEFGCGIDLYIYDTHITMNYGTKGNYSSKDKGLMTRAFLVPELWKNESTLATMMNKIIDMDVLTKYDKLRSEIYDLEVKIRKEEEDKEREEWLKKIKNAKYICDKRVQYVNERFDYNKMKFVNDGVQDVYTNHKTIKNITDKNIITIDNYGSINRLKLDKTIFYLKEGYYDLQSEFLKEGPVREEVSD